jgi:uncharacterized integral membrane protein
MRDALRFRGLTLDSRREILINERLTHLHLHAIFSELRIAGNVMGLRGIGENGKIIFIVIAVMMGFIFILQNFEQTSFQFLIWTLFTAPKWIVVSSTFLLGFAFGFLFAKKKA